MKLNHGNKLVLLMLFWVGCSQSPVKSAKEDFENEKMIENTVLEDDNMKDLKLRFTVKPKPDLGFGYSFDCELENRAPEFKQDSFILTVLVADQEIYVRLKTSLIGHIFRGTFSLSEENVPYNIMPITGFVDKEKKSWKLVSLD